MALRDHCTYALEILLLLSNKLLIAAFFSITISHFEGSFIMPHSQKPLSLIDDYLPIPPNTSQILPPCSSLTHTNNLDHTNSFCMMCTQTAFRRGLFNCFISCMACDDGLVGNKGRPHQSSNSSTKKSLTMAL